MIKQGTDPVVTTLCLSKYNNLGINYCMHVRMYVNLKLNDTNIDPSPSK